MFLRSMTNEPLKCSYCLSESNSISTRIKTKHFKKLSEFGIVLHPPICCKCLQHASRFGVEPGSMSDSLVKNELSEIETLLSGEQVGWDSISDASRMILRVRAAYFAMQGEFLVESGRLKLLASKVERVRKKLDQMDLLLLSRKNSLYERRREAASRYTSDPEVRSEIFKRDGMICKFCEATENLTLDHIVSVLNGGENTPSNIQVLCQPCNSSKGSR